ILGGPFNFGFLKYVEPHLHLSKIEENNRRLLLNTNDNLINDSTFTPESVAETLRLRNNQFYEIGVDANLFLLDFPQYKLSFFFDTSLNFGQTLSSDSVRSIDSGQILFQDDFEEISLNTTDLAYRISLTFNPDSRYGIEFGHAQHYYKLRSTRVTQVDDLNSYQSSGTRKENRNFRYAATSLEGFYSPNGENKLFIRYIFFHTVGNSDQNFEQFKLGYSFFLTADRKN
ncbi:MAG: hypothetical protein AAFX87_24330, partial [Bacteroidota bacterium]